MKWKKISIEENCIDTLRVMSGNKYLKEMPHYDTLNETFSIPQQNWGDQRTLGAMHGIT